MQHSDSSHRFREGLPLALVAGLSLLVGIAIWAAVIMSGASLIGDAVKEIDFDPAGAVALDCAEDSDGLSLEQQVRYDEECFTPTPEATSTPIPTPTPVKNRLDCAAIRGTDYLSREERAWFLDNCVSN
jgi:hypothetical protein